MYSLKYAITAKAPLVLSESGGENFTVSTKDYIPGTIVRGLLAGRYIKLKSLGSNAHDNEEFYERFLSGNVRFNHAYIAEVAENNNFIENVPLPFSIHYEKENPESLHDLLWEREVGEQTKPIEGYGRIAFNGHFNFVSKTTVNKSLNFHHQREKHLGTPRDQFFFNYESLNPGQVFIGDIRGSDEALTAMRTLIQDGEYSIGKSRGNQYGSVLFSWISGPVDIKTFHDRLVSPISMTFLSPVIILNEWGYSTCSKDVLEKLLAVKISENIIVKKSFIRQGEVENFVSVWKLRRPSDTCFQAGSCFLLDGIPEADAAKLKELEICGIGERCVEGFGRVVFGVQPNLKIALAKKESQNQNNNDRNDISKLEVPLKTMEILNSIIKTHFSNAIELRAISDANEFDVSKDSLTKSLAARLMRISSDQDDFPQLIEEDIRETAKSKLRNCRSDSETLYDFLTKGLDFNNLYNQPEIKELMDELHGSHETINSLIPKDNVERIYYRAFFTALMKKIQAETALREGDRK